MGILVLYLAVVAACLLWSAACVAAAARTSRRWLRWTLVALAVAVPVLALTVCVRLVALAGFLITNRFEAGLFMPPLVTCLAATLGAIAMPLVGLATSGGVRRAARWPAVGLVAMSLVAAASAWGTLLFVDNAVAAEARMLRAEAARIITAALPPPPTPDEDAAPLYERAFATLDADPAVSGPDSPLDHEDADIPSPEEQAILARHAATLDLLRQAADRPRCRFDHDWSELSIEMDLPEVQAMRPAARLLAVAARAEAAEGDAAAALADVVRIGRMGRHVAEMPLGVAGSTAIAIDGLALEVLAAVLPRLEPDDVPLLDSPNLAALLTDVPLVDRHIAGEEALTLTAFADVAEGRYRGTNDGDDCGDTAAPDVVRREPVGWRCFMMPTDLRFARRTSERLGALARSGPAGVPFAEYARFDAETMAAFDRRRPGMISGLMLPACSVVARFPYMAAARRAAAQALVAVTRERLAGGTAPESLAALVPDRLLAVPRDPFTADEPLRSKRSGDGWVVWSVGPDGEDDGGPVPPDVESVEGNDDVGLWMTTKP
ncbi:MAG: hypothetical protein ACKOSQ_00980 [Planctomycetaceae bacterium]